MKAKLIFIIIAIIVAALLGIYLFTNVRSTKTSDKIKFIDVCSFNISKIGLTHRTQGKLDILAKYIDQSKCDVLLVQELKGSIKDLTLASGQEVKADLESTQFITTLTSMTATECVTSDSDTGTDSQHHAVLANDWYLACYNPQNVSL